MKKDYYIPDCNTENSDSVGESRLSARRNGLKFYRTNVPCRRCNTDMRYTSTSNCVECNRVASRKAYKEKVTEKVKVTFTVTPATAQLLREIVRDLRE